MDNERDPQTSSTLLGLLRQDPEDARAWDVLVRRYRPWICRWCVDRGLQAEDAEDVSQQVLTRLISAMRNDRYDPSRQFRPWLKTITRNAWSDFLDARRRQGGEALNPAWLEEVEAPDDLNRCLGLALDCELLDIAIPRARDRVAEKTWEAFRLTALEGLSGADAARRLGLPVASVFVARHRVQQFLKSELQRLEGEA